MIKIAGNYFDGKTPIANEATLSIADNEAIVRTSNGTERFPLQKIRVSPAVGKAPRFVALPGGGQFSCDNRKILDSLPQESPSEGLVFWLEQKWGFALASVALVILALLFAYLRVLPRLASKVIEKIPFETEYKLGRVSLRTLDKTWLKPSQIDLAQQKRILQGFNRLTSGLQYKGFYRLEFRNTNASGPNAFALPGGTIVILDSLVKFTQNDEEAIAILAHEIGHTELRHALRSLMQDSAVGVLLSSFTNDANSVGAAVSGAPVVLATTRYSREFEAAADDYAFDLLKRKKYSPKSFGTFMKRLIAKYGLDGDSVTTFISTHPDTEERAKRAFYSASDGQTGEQRSAQDALAR